MKRAGGGFDASYSAQRAMGDEAARDHGLQVTRWLRGLAMQGTEPANRCAATSRIRLLRIRVAMIGDTRRVRLMYASHHPLRERFALSAANLGGASP